MFVEGRELVRLLLAAGADPTAQDAQHGRTALHTATMANDVELVKVSYITSFLRGALICSFLSII